MQTSIKLLAFWLALLTAGQAQVTLSGNASVTGQTLLCSTPSGGTVATPTLSQASGAVAPGTTATASDGTGGATIYYTLTTDGTTPPNPTYDSATYMPGLGTTSAIIGTAGTSGITASNTFVPNVLIDGPINIKLLAAKTGLTDSSIASYSYTLTAPTGTALSACQTLPGSTTYYLSGDVSGTGTCFIANGNNITLNLNGHTITYGTTSAVVLTGTGNVTSGSATVACASCTTGMIGDRMWVDDYNQSGGFQNNGTYPTIQPTITGVSGGNATLSANLGFTAAPAEYTVYGPSSYGFLCDPINYGTCSGLTLYNGTITQAANGAPGSHAIGININNGSGPSTITVANVTANISSPEAEFFYAETIGGGFTVRNNVVNDSVTTIYYRDGLPYPIKLDNHSSKPATSPINSVYDNKVYGSPQGDVYAGYTSNVFNNYYNHNGAYQYANGFCSFAAVDNDVFMGNSCNGFMQGNEEEASNDSFINNYTSIQMQDPVQDPNHNPPQCELGYGYREKDFNGSASQFLNVLNYNIFNDIDGACGANDIEFSLLYATDTTSVTGNVLTLNMNTSSPANASEIYGADGADMTGITFSGNSYTITGTYASQGYAAYFNYDQVQNWTLPGLASPAIFWRQGASGIDSNGTFTGSGTATCGYEPNAGSTSAITLTYNGSGVSCP